MVPKTRPLEGSVRARYEACALVWYPSAMPLSPKVRRERRAYQKTHTPQPAKPRKRCDNCGTLFVKKRTDQRFHTKACCDEFHKYGAAYGKLKELLTNLIHKTIEAALSDPSPKMIAALDAAGFARKDATPKNEINFAAAVGQLTARVATLEAQRQTATLNFFPSDSKAVKQ